MRRLLIFDFDGVIVNSEPHHIAACEEIVRRLSGGRVGADAVHTVGGSTESLYRRALEVCGAAGDAAALAREHFALTLARIRRDAPRPEPELTALLDALDGRGVATAVATSSPAGFVREILALYDLAGASRSSSRATRRRASSPRRTCTCWRSPAAARTPPAPRPSRTAAPARWRQRRRGCTAWAMSTPPPGTRTSPRRTG